MAYDQPVVAPEGILTLTDAVNGQQVNAQEGQILVLTLDGNPSTGYMWGFANLDASFLTVIDRHFQPESDLIGAPGKEIFRLRVLREGTTFLHLVYQRSWEMGRPPTKTFSVGVTIKGRLDRPPAIEPYPTVIPPAPSSPPSSSSISPQYGQVPRRYSSPHQPAEPAPLISTSSITLPAAFDWRALGGMTPVKDQDGCGSCWAFASAGVIESAIKIGSGIEADISEQYIVAHNEDGWSCNGGSTALDYYVHRKPSGEREAGAVLESECPYTASDNKCPGPEPMRHPYTVDGWHSLPESTAEIKEAIYRYGPVWTMVCTGPAFAGYTGGVFETDEKASCNGSINHAVVLVGWDDTQGSHGVWIMRNSWGTGWGENGGYMRIGYGISNIGQYSSYVWYHGTPLDPVGQVGGRVQSVYVQYPYAYIGLGSRLAVLNISDPAHPSLVGTSQSLERSVESIYIAGSQAYVSAGGLRILDVSTPSAPRLVGGFSDLSRDTVVSGTLAYVAGGGEVHILNVTDPAHPSQVSLVYTNGDARGIAVSGSRAYVANGTGLAILNVSNPISPTVITTTATPGYADDVAVNGNYAYVADDNRGLRVMDISDSAHPYEVSALEGFYANGVVLSGTQAFVAAWNGLRIVDVSNPISPTLLGSYANAYGSALAVHGSIAYVAGSDGLYIVNAANPYAPYEVGAYRLLAKISNVAITGTLAYVAAYEEGIQIVDLASPASPVKVGSYTPANARAVTASGIYLYVLDGSTLRVLSMIDPVHPTQMGSVNMPSSGNDVKVEGNYAYAATWSGLKIVNVSSPASPYVVGTLDIPGGASRLAIAGNYAYVIGCLQWNGTAYVGGGLHIIDISNPVTPTQTAFYDTPADARAVGVEGSYAYVADMGMWKGSESIPGGVYVLDISDPYSPTHVTTISDRAGGITIKDKTAYVFGDGVQAFDISNPAEPQSEGSINLGDWIEALTVSDDYAWAGSELGLYGLRLLWDRDTGYISAGGGSLIAKARDTSFSFPSGTFGQEAAVTYRQLWQDPQVSGLAGVGHTFLLDAVSHASSQPVSPTLSYSVVITYTPGPLNSEGTLALYAWNGVQWVREPTSVVDQARHRLSANLHDMGMFSVLGTIPPSGVTARGRVGLCEHLGRLYGQRQSDHDHAADDLRLAGCRTVAGDTL